MHDFVERLENQTWVFNDKERLEKWADQYAEACRQSILRQYHRDEENEVRSPVRVSSLGKPAVEVALKLPHVVEELKAAGLYVEEVPDEKLKYIFHSGDVFEGWLGLTLQRYGYELIWPTPTGEQKEVEYTTPCGASVKGHLDFIVKDPTTGEQFVVEAKTMSSYYFSKFTKCPDDERGYITQLAMYTHCTGLPGVWVCVDKGTSEVAVVRPDEDVLKLALDRVNKVLPRFSQVQCFDDIARVFKAPPGEPEVYRKKLTGKLLMPRSMKYSPNRHLFYNTFVEKNGYYKHTEYVGEFDVAEYGNLETDRQRERFCLQHTDYRKPTIASMTSEDDHTRKC